VNRRRTFGLMAILILWVAVRFVADDDMAKYLTRGRSNGRVWAIFDLNAKLTYLDGLHDGAVEAALLVSGKNYFPAEMNAGDFSNKEIVKQIDAFYTDGSNVRVPIVWAFQYMVKKTNGTKSTDLEDYAATLRKLSNEK